jgi:hypothetical protein
MTKHNCVGNAELREGELNQFRLGARRPHNIARPLTMAESRTIKNDNPVIFGKEIYQAAGFKILDHAPVAVEKNHRGACATLNIMQSDAVNLQKATGRRIVALGFVRKISIGHGHRSQSSNHRR